MKAELKDLIEGLKGNRAVPWLGQKLPPFKEDLDAYRAMKTGSERKSYIIRSVLHRLARQFKQDGGTVTRVTTKSMNALGGGIGKIHVTIPEGESHGRGWAQRVVHKIESGATKYVQILVLPGPDPDLTFEITYGSDITPKAEELA